MVFFDGLGMTPQTARMAKWGNILMRHKATAAVDQNHKHSS